MPFSFTLGISLTPTFISITFQMPCLQTAVGTRGDVDSKTMSFSPTGFALRARQQLVNRPLPWPLCQVATSLRGHELGRTGRGMRDKWEEEEVEDDWGDRTPFVNPKMRTGRGHVCPLVLPSYAVACHPKLVLRKRQLASELPSNHAGRRRQR